MGIFDFFKRKKQEIEIEKIKFENLESWLKNRKQKNKEKQEKFLIQINEKISQLIIDLEKQIDILKNKDIDERKVEQKIKLVVKENLDQYITYLNRLINDLREIKRDDKIINNLDKVFSDFEKKSIMSYQKATILIGEELEKTRDYIAVFSRDIKNILESNKSLIKELEVLGVVDNKMKDIEDVRTIEKEISETISDNKKKVKDLTNEMITISREINQIIKSEEYLEQEKKQRELIKLRQDFERAIIELKAMFDFKELSNIFHTSVKKMNIIKEYKNNFKQAFEKDKGKNIIELIKESNISIEAILVKIEEVENLKDKINSIVIKDLTKDLEDEKNKIEIKIAEIELEASKQNKRFEKLDEREDEMKNLIKQELSSINIELK